MESTTQNPATQPYQHLIDNGYEFQLGDYINRGWEIFKKDPGPFIGYTLLMMVIMVVAAFTIIGIFFVAGPLVGGFYIYANKVANDEPRSFSDFFEGFAFTGQLAISMLVTAVLVFIGYLLLFIPGIYLAVAYGFTIPLIVLGGMDFWSAMETSRKVITKNWFWFFLFGIVVGIIAAVGEIALIIGIFVTMPIAMCIQYAAFEGIMGSAASHSYENKIDEIGTIDEIDDTQGGL